MCFLSNFFQAPQHMQIYCQSQMLHGTGIFTYMTWTVKNGDPFKGKWRIGGPDLQSTGFQAPLTNTRQNEKKKEILGTLNKEMLNILVVRNGFFFGKKKSRFVGNSAGDPFGMVKWPFERLSDLQIGYKKVTLNHCLVSRFDHLDQLGRARFWSSVPAVRYGGSAVNCVGGKIDDSTATDGFSYKWSFEGLGSAYG